MTTAGQLRERISFQARRPVPAGDGAGNFEGEWCDEFTESARVLPLKGGEQILASRLTGIQPVIITVRASRATRRISAAWRAVDARTGRIYAITAPPADFGEDGAFLDIMASAGAPA